jgi:2-dehydropantoate 2-reductase
MRIAVVGAGGVGGYFGARLAEAGNEVVFLARGATLEALRTRGLRVSSRLGDVQLPVRAESDPALVGTVELVILAVKAYSNREALALLPPLLGPDTAVLTLQNGVESVEEVASVVGPHAVLGGSAYIVASLAAPGIVEHAGTVQRIVFGEGFGERVRTARVERIEQALAGARIEAKGVADCRVSLWDKYIFLGPLAGFTGAARLPLGPLWAEPAFRQMIEGAMEELAALARAEGVGVAPDVVSRTIEYLAACHPRTRTSLMVDLMAGRPIEVEALMGAAVRRGLAHKVPTPIMGTLYAALKPHADGHPEGLDR